MTRLTKEELEELEAILKREDIPKLLLLIEFQKAELERLNDVIKQLTETTESFLDDKHFYMDELRKANAEIERYKETMRNERN